MLAIALNALVPIMFRNLSLSPCSAVPFVRVLPVPGVLPRATPDEKCANARKADRDPATVSTTPASISCWLGRRVVCEIYSGRGGLVRRAGSRSTGRAPRAPGLARPPVSPDICERAAVRRTSQRAAQRRARTAACRCGTHETASSQPRPYRYLVPTSVPTFPWRRETPGYASKWSTYWNL
jgi:hypothetical protein